MLLKRLLYPYQNPVTDGGDAGGGAPEPSDSADAGVPPGAGDTSSTPSTDAGVSPPTTGDGADAEGPKTLHEAMWGKDGKGGLAAAKEPIDESKPGEEPDAKKPGEQQQKQRYFEHVPKGLTPEAESRFRRLAGEAKKERQQREQFQGRAEAAERKNTEFLSIMRESGVTADAFADFCETMHLANSGNYDQAAQRLISQLRNISIVAGKNYLGGGGSVLDEFPDLNEKVANMQLGEEDALRLARAQRIEQARNKQIQQEQQQQQFIGNWAQHREIALATVRKMVEHYKATDLDFARKEAKLAAKMSRLAEIHPSKWPAQVKLMYEDLTEAATAFGTSPGKEMPRPLSGGGAPSKATRAPQSTYEAMWGTPRPA